MFGLVGLACAKDPAREEALRLARDQTALKSVVDADLNAEHALTEVGEAEKHEKDDDAAHLLETKVIPATDSAISLARATQPETAWGRARKDEMLGVMLERRDELPKYIDALRAHDFEAELASVSKQIPIEQRAMAAAQAISDGPDGGAR